MREKKVTHAINTLIWDCPINCKSEEGVSVWNLLVHSSPFRYSATISKYHHQTHTLYFCLSYCWFDSVILNEFQKYLTGTNRFLDLKIPKLYFHQIAVRATYLTWIKSSNGVYFVFSSIWIVWSHEIYIQIFVFWFIYIKTNSLSHLNWIHAYIINIYLYIFISTTSGSAYAYNGEVRS